MHPGHDPSPAFSDHSFLGQTRISLSDLGSAVTGHKRVLGINHRLTIIAAVSMPHRHIHNLRSHFAEQSLPRFCFPGYRVTFLTHTATPKGEQDSADLPPRLLVSSPPLDVVHIRTNRHRREGSPARSARLDCVEAGSSASNRWGRSQLIILYPHLALICLTYRLFYVALHPPRRSYYAPHPGPYGPESLGRPV